MPAPSYLRRHPRTGIYWFRRAVPPSLRPSIGQCEIVRTLKTRDHREARRLALVQALEVEDMLAQAEGRPGLFHAPASPSAGPLATSSLCQMIEAAVARALGQITAASHSTVVSPDSLRLSVAFERYNTERQLRPQGHTEFKAAIRRLQEVIGHDPMVAEITKAHIRTFKDALIRMPKVMTARDRALPLPKLLARFEGKDTAPAL